MPPCAKTRSIQGSVLLCVTGSTRDSSRSRTCSGTPSSLMMTTRLTSAASGAGERNPQKEQDQRRGATHAASLTGGDAERRPTGAGAREHRSMLHRAQAGEPEIAVRRSRANLRDQALGLGSGVGIGAQSRHGPADGARVPHHIGARTGCQELDRESAHGRRNGDMHPAGLRGWGPASRDRHAVHE